MARIHIPTLSEVFPRDLSRALATLGDYVYAYYRPGEFRPFYVGKGKGARVLQHWREAISSKTNPKAHEVEILRILKAGRLPVVKLLAYNLEKTPMQGVYSTVERALQDAFGIQLVWEKKPVHDDEEIAHEAALLQTREDSAKHPVLTLEAVLAKADLGEEVTKADLVALTGAPTLLVGLSKTYHPSYEQALVADMARRFWELNRYANTSFGPFCSANSSVLIAWSSMVNGAPMIVGVWRVKPDSVRRATDGTRYEMEVLPDLDHELRKRCLGVRLKGTGNNWQGPRILVPG